MAALSVQRAIGGTRTELLDWLLILALLGGLSVPIGHQMMKRIVLAREKAEAEKAAAAGGEDKNP